MYHVKWQNPGPRGPQQCPRLCTYWLFPPRPRPLSPTSLDALVSKLNTLSPVSGSTFRGAQRQQVPGGNYTDSCIEVKDHFNIHSLCAPNRSTYQSNYLSSFASLGPSTT